jgi:PAS domain-containing protein
VNAITQLQFDSPGSIDPALLFAAINALPQSLAVVVSGNVLYVNLAWAQMFEYADPSQIRGRRLDDFTPLSHYCHGGTVPEGLQLGFARSTPGKSDVGFGG